MHSHSPDSLNLFLASRLTPPNKQMFRLLFTPLNPQELIKLQHPLLTARPSLAPLMENRMSRMENTLLLLPRDRRVVSGIAPSPTTGGIRGDLQRRIIGFRLFRYRCRRSSRSRWANGRCYSRLRRLRRHGFRGGAFSDGRVDFGFLCGFSGGVVDGGMFAGGAG